MGKKAKWLVVGYGRLDEDVITHSTIKDVVEDLREVMRAADNKWTDPPVLGFPKVIELPSCDVVPVHRDNREVLLGGKWRKY